MAIDLSQVYFHYPDQPNRSILHIPSWSLAEGEHVFIHGPSGAGKSTLLNLLSGLLLPSDGEVTMFGQRLDKMNRRQRDRFRVNNIGYVFQQFNLIPYLSAFDNVRLARQFCHFRKTSVLASEIKQLFCSLNITEQDWLKPARYLSHGQQQRIAIARALINKPKLLIADEPTSSLDASNTKTFMALLMSVISDNDMTLVFVSHDQTLASYFHRIDSFQAINQRKGEA